MFFLPIIIAASLAAVGIGVGAGDFSNPRSPVYTHSVAPAPGYRPVVCGPSGQLRPTFTCRNVDQPQPSAPPYSGVHVELPAPAPQQPNFQKIEFPKAYHWPPMCLRDKKVIECPEPAAQAGMRK